MTTSFHTPLHYLRAFINARLSVHFGHTSSLTIGDAPALQDGSPFATWIDEVQPGREELISLLLALVPHLQPGFLEDILAEYIPEGSDFIPIGGVKNLYHRGLLPTGETLLFILAGNDTDARVAIQNKLLQGSIFRQGILRMEAVPPGAPAMSGRLLLSEETIIHWLTGNKQRSGLPTGMAERISTGQEWNDLVLNNNTMQQVQEITQWLKYANTMQSEWQLKSGNRAGYRALFHGPAGTGKTMAAALLGRNTQREVFRIDLSRVVSRYIDETEKNLNHLFDKAEQKDWVLFFDEADALLGKRTEIKDVHDRYATLETNYLLQRMEAYKGLIILSSRYKENMDDSFLHRLQNIVHFPVPAPSERYLLWSRAFPDKIKLAESISLEHISRHHELTGANINSIAFRCCLKLFGDQRLELSDDDLKEAIHLELVKEGKV